MENFRGKGVNIYASQRKATLQLTLASLGAAYINGPVCQSTLLLPLGCHTQSTTVKRWQAGAKDTHHTSRSLSSLPFNQINMDPLDETHNMLKTHYTQTHAYASKKNKIK